MKIISRSGPYAKYLQQLQWQYCLTTHSSYSVATVRLTSAVWDIGEIRHVRMAVASEDTITQQLQVKFVK